MSNRSLRRIAALGATLALAILLPAGAEPGVPGLVVNFKGIPVTLSSSPILPKETDGSTYGPENLLDGKLTTAWCPASRSEAWVQFDFPRQVVNFISVANGYQRVTAKGTKLFPANARVSALRVEDSGGIVIELKVSDSDGTQDWTFPRGSRFGSYVTSLRFTIEGYFPGAKWQDVLLSSLEFGYVEEDNIGSGG